MKISIASDIHLEFGDLVLKNQDAADVLILSGDICVAADIGSPDPSNIFQSARASRVRDFFKRCSFQFPHVIYIMGNHEHYHGDFSETYNKIKGMLTSDMLSNVYLLEKETKIIDDYMFIGGTLWTDFNRGDAASMRHAGHVMNDFSGVKYKAKGLAGGNWRFLPDDALQDHYRMKDYISTVIDNRRAQGRRDRRVVVVGHHCPSAQSVHERYRNDFDLNGSFRSHLDEFILDRPEIALWTHGHTHEDFDYMIGTTRVVCNPRGYIGYEPRADTWQLKTIQLP